MTPDGPGWDPRWLHRHPRVIGALALLFLFALAAALTVVQPRTSNGGARAAESVAARLAAAKADGAVAPSFALPSIQGTGTISLQNFRGRVVVLNFWASWCGPCREEAPQLQAVWQAYRGRGVQFLGVDHRDDRTAAIAFQRRYGISYPSVSDPAGELSARYRMIGVPTTFVIDGAGRIRFRFVGKVDAPLLRGALAQVLAGKAA